MMHKDAQVKTLIGAAIRVTPESDIFEAAEPPTPQSPSTFINHHTTRPERYAAGMSPQVTAAQDYHSYIIERFEEEGYDKLDPRRRSINITEVMPSEIVAKFSLNTRLYSPHELLFIEFYIVTLSHHQAAKRLGITAGEARKMSLDPAVKNLISARLRFSMMDVEELLARVVRIARFDFGSYIDIAEEDDSDRPNRRDSSVSVDWSSMIEAGDSYALKKFNRNKYGISAEPYDKLKALELVAKVLKLFASTETTQNINVTHMHESQLRVEELRELSDEELTALANNLSLANRAASSSGVGEMEARPEERETIPARVDDATQETPSTR